MNAFLRVLIVFVLCASSLKHTEASQNREESEVGSNTGNAKDNSRKSSQFDDTYSFPGCRLYLAKSTIPHPDAHLGLFTTQPLRRGQPIAPPDILIQLTDYLKEQYDENNSTNLLISQYSWNAQRFGAQFEAKTVASILPGVGSLANAMTTFKDSNAMPFGRDVDEANVPRTKYSQAGSFTHYHNLTFYATKDLQPGQEIFIYYGSRNDSGDNGVNSYHDEWYQHRIRGFHNKTDGDNDGNYYTRDTDWLNKHGICINNLEPKKSIIKGAGRGAVASRFIPKNAIVAPVPLIVTNRNATMTQRVKNGGKIRKPRPQLLTNYCLGHTNSSLLFFPISPVVNLINHADPEPQVGSDDSAIQNGKKNFANVKLQWSTSSQHDGKDWPYTLSFAEANSTLHSKPGLVMEYIATRDIYAGEEILLDYGPDWVKAFHLHQPEWKPSLNAHTYSPSYVMDEVAAMIRTEKEQRTHPYSKNLMTACFYQYSNYKAKNGRTSSSKNEPVLIPWKMDRLTFEYENLRPCSIIQREEVGQSQGGGRGESQPRFAYTSLMKNWNGMKKEEMIPEGEMHVVNAIPRQAIRFVDKMYTSDQHLNNAFRHEIQIPDDIFPKEWMDLV